MFSSTIDGFPPFIARISSNHCWLANQQWALRRSQELFENFAKTVTEPSLEAADGNPSLPLIRWGHTSTTWTKRNSSMIFQPWSYHISYFCFFKNAGNAPAFKNMLRFNTSSRGCIGFRVDHETNLESKWIPIQQDNSTNPIKSNFQAVMANVILQTTLSRVAGMRTQNLPLSYLQLGEHHDCQHASVFRIHVIMLLAQASTIEVANSPSLTHCSCWWLI